MDGVLELLYFGCSGAIRGADAYLAANGLTRVHYRILYVVARRDGVTVGDLLMVLRVSKQALHRPMKQLIAMGFLVSVRREGAHRFKELRLTDQGRDIEANASNHEREILQSAFAHVGPESRTAWCEVMTFLARHG